MITVPTCELLRLLGTAIGFAAADKEQHWFGVQLSWDGDGLSAAGFDTLSGGRLTWVPYEGAESATNTEDDPLRPDWGSNQDDEQWQVFISVLAAKEIVKTFKLPAKHALTPVTIKVTPTGSSLIVERSRDTGHSQHLGMWPNDPDRAARFPDIAEVAQGSLVSGVGKITDTMKFNPYRLAAFGALSDTLTMRFGFGSDPTAVTAGDRFIGFIYPAGVTPGAASTSAGSDLLRNGSGVLVAGKAGSGKSDRETILGAEVTRQSNGTIMVENA